MGRAATIRAVPTSASTRRRASIQLEIKGLAEPKTPEAERICREDLTELVTAFVQDKQAIEARDVRRGTGAGGTDAGPDGQDREGEVPEPGRGGSGSRPPARGRGPELVQQAKKALIEAAAVAKSRRTLSLIDGVRKFALSVRELDIDLIDRINPFGEAYAILAKSMSEERLKAVAEVIAARRVSMTLEEARDLAKRAKRFKEEKGRLPRSPPWTRGRSEWPRGSPSCSAK